VSSSANWLELWQTPPSADIDIIDVTVKLGVVSLVVPIEGPLVRYFALSARKPPRIACMRSGIRSGTSLLTPMRAEVLEYEKANR